MSVICVSPAAPGRAVVGGFQPNSFAFVVYVGDLAPTTDATQNAAAMAAADVVTPADVRLLATGCFPSDTVTATESCNKHADSQVAETMSVAESSETAVDARMFLSDDATLSATNARDFGVNATETVNMTDWSKQKKAQNDFHGA